MFVKDMGVDLGTASVSIYVRGRGIVLQEPSLVAVGRADGELQAVGQDAAELLGHSAGRAAAIRPIQGGVISDYGMTERMLKAYLKKTLGGSPFKPNLVVCVPSGITEVEERAVIETGMQSGARRVYLMETPVAAALGAGLDISRPVGVMVVDIGGGTCDAAVLSLGGIVESESRKAAGTQFDEALIRYLRRRESILIGERTAEEIKLSIGCVMPREEPLSLSVRGRDLSSGFPRTCEVNAEQTREAYLPVAEEIAEAIRLVLERTPPELVSDIMRDGIHLTGGGSLLYGMAPWISEQTGIPAQVAENAPDCAVLGAGAALSNLRELPDGALHLARRRKIQR